MVRDWNQMREHIIGLGEESSRKSFYPELQQRLEQLEETREALKRSQENLLTLFNSLHDAIIIISNLDGRVLEVNDAMLKMYRVSRAEFADFGLADYSTTRGNDISVPDAIRRDWPRLCAGDHLLFDWRAHRPKDGSTFDVEVSLRKAEWYGQDVMVGVLRDITERKRLEAMLLQSQRLDAIGQLAGGVAHDTNNMLGVILGYVDLIAEEAELSPSTREGLGEIKKAAQHSSQLIRQLLAFARQQSIQPQSVDLNALIESTQKILRRLLGENISLVWKPANQLWPVWVDPTQIDQILANLAVNARDAIREHGTITLTTANETITPAFCQAHLDAAPGDYVHVSITDTGQGMSPEIQSRIFEPFFTTKAPGQGTGLGLAMVYGILRQNKGFVILDSAPGEGTTFHLYLPRLESATSMEQNTASEAPAPEGTETILLVEDEEALLELESRLLRKAGYRVIPCSNPGMAISLVQQGTESIPLLVSDIVMPDMNGRELYERLQPLLPNLKVLFMSGYSGDAIGASEPLGPGADFLPKPFKRTELLCKVRSLLNA